MKYDDAWIIEHWESCRNWLTLCNKYNASHGTSIGYNTFKSHCNRELELNFHYSEEQEDFLREVYPACGRNKTAKLFNERFKCHKTPQAIKLHCQRNLGLRVTAERKAERFKENTNRYYENGAIRKASHGELYIKIDDDWIRLKEYNLGRKVKKGCAIVYLDGNKDNCEPSNLVEVDRATLAIMTKNEFWSEDAEITATGIIWCDLYKSLKRKGAI